MSFWAYFWSVLAVMALVGFLAGRRLRALDAEESRIAAEKRRHS